MTLIAIWTRQYIREKDLRRDTRIYMTDERMTTIVNDAYEAGKVDGANEGRYDFRKACEEAGVSFEKYDRSLNFGEEK